MTLPSFTQILLKAKKEKKLSFEDLGLIEMKYGLQAYFMGKLQLLKEKLIF